MKKGCYSGRKERKKNHAQLRTMGDNPTKFQHHPLKTVGEVVFTTISYISISKYLKNAAQKKKKQESILTELRMKNKLINQCCAYTHSMLYKLIHLKVLFHISI